MQCQSRHAKALCAARRHFHHSPAQGKGCPLRAALLNLFYYCALCVVERAVLLDNEDTVYETLGSGILCN